VSNVRGNLLGRFAPCRAPHARVALRQPAGDACGDRDGSLDVQEVTEVRHDLEDTRVEQPTVLVGRRHDAAVVAAMELQQGCCNVRLGLAHAIEERREWAHDRAVVLERCGQAALETGVQLVTARGVEREARRPGAPQAIDQGELAAAHEIVGSWELEQAHIPALLPLLRVGERAQEGGRVRDRERDRATDVRRRGGAHGVGDHAAPVMADEVDLAVEAIDQGEGVGSEGVEVVGADDRRGSVAAQPWRDDAVGLGKVLEERDGGRRVIGEAV
jgi:hypothetical protein